MQNSVISIFIPSARKILFFQKKIRLLIVQFMLYSVSVQMLESFKLVACLFSKALSKTMYVLVHMVNTTRQATTNKQEEILFRFMVALFSGFAKFFLRTSLEILNSLMLKYTRGRNVATMKMMKATFTEMTGLANYRNRAQGNVKNQH